MSLLPTAPSNIRVKRRPPQGAFAQPCRERALAAATRRILTKAGWTVKLEPIKPKGKLGLGMTVGMQGATGEIRVGCIAPGQSWCENSETNYLIAGRDMYIEQSAASFGLMSALLEVLASHMGTVHCFGTDQTDLERSYWASRGRVTTYLSKNGCTGEFSAGARADAKGALLLDQWANLPVGAVVYWIDHQAHPVVIRSKVTTTKRTFDIKVKKPGCRLLEVKNL